MPRRHLGRDHEQLVQHERGIGDGDHAQEVVIGDADEQLRQALDHAALVDAHKHPDEKGTVAEAAAGGELLVQLRVEVRERFVHVPVEDEREDGEHGVDGGVADEEPVL